MHFTLGLKDGKASLMRAFPANVEARGRMPRMAERTALMRAFIAILTDRLGWLLRAGWPRGAQSLWPEAVPRRRPVDLRKADASQNHCDSEPDGKRNLKEHESANSAYSQRQGPRSLRPNTQEPRTQPRNALQIIDHAQRLDRPET